MAAGDPLHGAARDIGDASILDVAMGDAGADHEFVAAAFRLLQFGKPRDIDDQIRLDQAQIQHRAERLAAGDDLGRVLGLGHQSDRGVQV